MTGPTGIDPIRILHVLPDLETGGLQHGVIRLINGLSSEEFHHQIVCLHGNGRLGTRLPRYVQVRELRAGWHDPRTAFRIARAIRAYRPHVVHARNWSTWPDATLATRLARSGPLIFSLHGWDTDARCGPLRAWACRRLARRTDHLLSVSRRAADLFALETGLDARRFEVLANGVDLNRFRPRPDGAAARREVGLGSDSFVIGSVGRLETIKDYGLLIRALAALTYSRGIHAELLLVGDGGRRPDLERLSRELRVADRVRFVGWRDDVPRLLGAMDVFAMSSRREGMNNAVLEAMACRLPIVATAVGGTPELIEDGRHGRLVPAGEVETMTKVLADLADRPWLRREMGRRARLRAERLFSLESALVRYAEMYRSLAREHVSKPVDRARDVRFNAAAGAVTVPSAALS